MIMFVEDHNDDDYDSEDDDYISQIVLTWFIYFFGKNFEFKFNEIHLYIAISSS